MLHYRLQHRFTRAREMLSLWGQTNGLQLHVDTKMESLVTNPTVWNIAF